MTRVAGCALRAGAQERAETSKAQNWRILFTECWTSGSVTILLHGVVELFHPAFAFEHFARPRAVRRADDAVLLHQVDQVRGTAVADAQAALQRGSRSAAHLADD